MRFIVLSLILKFMDSAEENVILQVTDVQKKVAKCKLHVCIAVDIYIHEL